MLTTVITHATGDLLPASDWNTYIRDNLNWLIEPGDPISESTNVLDITNGFHTVTGGGTVDTLLVDTPVVGQWIRLFCVDPITFSSGVDNIVTIAGVPRNTAANELVEFVFDGTNWNEALPQSGSSMLYDNLLGADATSISTDTLPTTFKHLLLITRSRTDSATTYPGADLLRMRVNGDTGGNYDSTSGDGRFSTGGSSMIVGLHTMGTSGAHLFATNIILIPDYNSAIDRKIVLGIASAGFSTNNDSSAPIGVFTSQGSWRPNATPITSLTFLTGPTVGTTNIVAGSRFTVYGLN